MSQLDHILAVTKNGLDERKRRIPRTELERKAARHEPRGFAHRLRERAAIGPAVIAEIKKASPSRGVIRADFDPSALAKGFAAAGAAALSVLTEEQFFLGSLDYLESASQISGLPCLRKDFILDEFQLLEARAYCTDAILLIASMLDDRDLRNLSAEAHDLQLDVLLEVHSKEELVRALALDLGSEAIGVNNRDLRTFDVRIESSIELASMLPAGIVRVAESGIRSAEDIAQLRAAGYDAFLIGEYLMRQPDPGKTLEALIAAAGDMTAAAAVKS